MKGNKTTTRSVDEFRDRLFRDRPSLERLWSETQQKRDIAVMLVGLRKSANLTQQELAEIAGWDKSYVSRLESANGGVPDFSTVTRYVNACHAIVGIVVASPEGGQLRVLDGVDLSGSGADFSRLRSAKLEGDDGDEAPARMRVGAV